MIERAHKQYLIFFINKTAANPSKLRCWWPLYCRFCTRTTTNGHGASITCYSTKKSRDHSTSLASHSVSLHGLADRNGILRKSHLFEPVINRNPAGQTYCSVGTCTVGQSLVEVPSHATHEKVGVLLLNLGGPDTLQDVQPFLFNLFADPVSFLIFLMMYLKLISCSIPLMM